MVRTVRPLLCAAALLFTGCSSGDPTGANGLRVLFVGNSLTYTNDLPAMVATFAESEELAFGYKTIAFPNYALQDHWYHSDARSELSEGNWDFVVMQQGPSSLPENQESLRFWAAKFADEARLYGTEPALYMVWPADVNSATFPAVVDSYTLAADAVAGLLLPAGAAWLAAWNLDASLPLYGPDGFHPSETGTYLAALAVFAGLTGSSPVGLPSTLELPAGGLTIPASRARLLQDATASVLSGP